VPRVPKHGQHRVFIQHGQGATHDADGTLIPVREMEHERVRVERTSKQMGAAKGTRNEKRKEDRDAPTLSIFLKLQEHVKQFTFEADIHAIKLKYTHTHTHTNHTG
jgi:hypothetical protein